jgi:CheY-like chemotaxis protein/HPt (histidine-containing phosphotransfer) domain-containing protein
MQSVARGALRVLIAEDNEVNRRVACFLLQDAGYHVVAVDDGKKAVAALAAQSFDLVLMDGHMPELDGIEATRVIRERERGSGRHTPIIALTAQAMPGDRERYYAAGMDGYLSKPFQSAQLHAAIRDVLGKSPSSALRAQPSAKPDLSTTRAEGPRAATRARGSLPVYDRAALLGRLRGLDNVLRQMVIVFAEEAPELLAGVRRALDSGELRMVEKAAHKLAGALLTVSGNRAGETARALENAARAGELNDGEALFVKLSQELIALHQSFRLEGDLSEGAAALPANSDGGAAGTPDQTP